MNELIQFDQDFDSIIRKEIQGIMGNISYER